MSSQSSIFLQHSSLSSCALHDFGFLHRFSAADRSRWKPTGQKRSDLHVAAIISGDEDGTGKTEDAGDKDSDEDGEGVQMGNVI